MLSNPLSTHLVTYLNSPSFSDLLLHPRCSLDPLPASLSLDFHNPSRHNSIVSSHPLNPLRHSQSLTLPLPSFSPSASPSPSFSPSPSLPPFSLDTDPVFYAHRVILAGRSPFWLRLLSSLPPSTSSSTSIPLPLTFPSLSPTPLISLLPSTASLLHLSLLIHPDALSLLLKFVYTGKIDLSPFSSHPPSRLSSPSSSSPDLTEDGPSPFSPEACGLTADSPSYSSVLAQQLLFYSRLFELQSLYSALTVHLCIASPRELQLHLQQMAAVKADPASAALPAEGLSSRSRFASAPFFLSSSALRYGHHQAARGVFVRIHAGREGEGQGMSAERVEYAGQQWLRYKVDPLLFACRSGFFQAMFNADWKENQVYADEGSATAATDSALQFDVVLEALNAAEFEHLLQFLYTDEMATSAMDGVRAEWSALSRSFQHLAIDSRWTLRLMRESPAFTHLVSLLSFATMYQIPSMGELLQHLMAQHISAETVCAIWPLVLNAFFSPASSQPGGEVDAEVSSGLHMPAVEGSMEDGEAPQLVFTELEILHEACLSFTCQHFLRLARHPSFLSLPLALLKQALDPGTVECDSTGMIEALERWIDSAVEGERLKDGAAVEERKKELRLCLFPPSTLFNRSEKAHVMMGNRAFFTRFGWVPPARG